MSGSVIYETIHLNLDTLSYLTGKETAQKVVELELGSVATVAVQSANLANIVPSFEPYCKLGCPSVPPLQLLGGSSSYCGLRMADLV